MKIKQFFPISFVVIIILLCSLKCQSQYTLYNVSYSTEYDIVNNNVLHGFNIAFDTYGVYTGFGVQFDKLNQTEHIQADMLVYKPTNMKETILIGTGLELGNSVNRGYFVAHFVDLKWRTAIWSEVLFRTGYNYNYKQILLNFRLILHLTNK